MSQFISLQEAIDLTSNYRTNKENILDSAYRNQGVLPICETFDRGVLDVLLAQTNCAHIRIYLGMDSNYKVKVVVVGADSNGNDILIKSAELIGEEAQRCPPICPSSSPLNS
jgi:hypothetical protein